MSQTCPYCNSRLVEVDNPMRREIRHPRGIVCSGPPASSVPPTPERRDWYPTPAPSGSEPVDPAQPGRWRKKPVVIEAMRYTAANGDECAAWVDEVFDGWQLAYGSHPPMLRIRTLEGVMEASEGDWIIRGVQGEFYPCKPDIFAATYEPEDHR